MTNRNVHIENHLNCKIIYEKEIGGGCIAQTSVISMSNGKNYFLKTGFKGSMFSCEANGLKELQKAKAIRIPELILHADDFLLLEHIESGKKKPSFYKQFGEQLAKVHQVKNDAFGFFENNYIGSNPQINSYRSNWIDFYFENRLMPQYRLAENNGYCDHDFSTAFKSIESQLTKILNDSEEAPCLLHGDLWGGNYLVDIHGNPVLIDPAVYYGHREADLAMTKLFGGFDNVFYQSYHQTYPLKEGYLYRENIYLLYHVLNHLNLFGTSYKQQALALMRSYQ
ncbi:fructosamine kinase family protein [Carboxylicivirga sp. M1479]|uniref:fructosamine kinase family protein n=1 Tax=Carboxylicivirga sp. M1479 TaxID=2594476 RepID=UPI00117887CE|nr:fructosamine kinase family protein [Carboxylicivirga sp. M1479]TRX71476.1 fructosamine kinase family protein [Carboxylicivirga sp. M1479]